MELNIDEMFFNVSRPGHIWAVRKGPFTHLGLETSNGTMISASPFTRGVAEISKEEFADGQTPLYFGYPGHLPYWEVELRAFKLIGKPYTFWKNNCEHLVTEAHGLQKHSPQFRYWAMAGIVCLVGFVAFKSLRAN